ncbi:hypothetical protein ACS0KU_004864 [Vibrio alginolyticus]
MEAKECENTVTSFPDAGVFVKTGNEENILRGELLQISIKGNNY